jgi:hypothetical protein
MKKFITFLGHLLSNSPKASLRRFVSFVLMIPFVCAIFCGIFVAVKYQRFDFFITSICLSALPLMITLFGLQWQHVIELMYNVKHPTNDKATISEELEEPPINPDGND